jgi:ubiquitin carboxyl-terminal hydrolase 4/11/15
VITSLNARLKYLPSAHRLSDVCEIDFDGTTGSASLRPLNGEADPSYLSLLNENAGSKVRTYKEIDITMCLDKFVEREAMPEEETWYCPKCKQHKAPFKKFDIWAAPEILIIQLKRFQFIPGSYFVHREKINDQVVFPERGLDLGPYLQGQGQGAELPPPIYDLFAVSEHSGGLGGGHYTAICKTPGTEDW